MQAPQGPQGQYTVEQVVEMTVDSGACNTIGPKEVGSHFPLYETEASRSGMEYVSASGGTVRNVGERVIHGTTGDWKSFNMKMQVETTSGRCLGQCAR